MQCADNKRQMAKHLPNYDIIMQIALILGFLVANSHSTLLLMQTHAGRRMPGFLSIVLVQTSLCKRVCVCVCPQGY